MEGIEQRWSHVHGSPVFFGYPYRLCYVDESTDKQDAPRVREKESSVGESHTGHAPEHSFLPTSISYRSPLTFTLLKPRRTPVRKRGEEADRTITFSLL